MDLFAVIALLVAVSAVYSYFNARFIRLPGTIGIVSVAIAVSLLTIAIDKLIPGAAKYLTALAKHINFSSVVLNIVLGFLLYAGSFNLNAQRLKKEMNPVLILSTIGVVLSTTIFGLLFYYAGILFQVKVPLVYCLLFGALISPTDPVAVAGIVKGSKLPASLETIILGESLFNDGLGLVLFITILEITESGSDHVDLAKATLLFVREVFGGIAMGALLGFVANRVMRSITDFQTIVLVSLALVMSVSVLAELLHLSIPLSVVAAGLVSGNSSINLDNQERSHQLLERFWMLVDEMLNTILFVMIGLQMINLPFLHNYWLIGGISIVIALMSRWLSIMLPSFFLRRRLNVNDKYKSISVLTWAGLRGGISIALALALPLTPYRHLILSGSYFIVIFSIIVQGLTLNKLINFLYGKTAV
jgi:monovalent cation:H+ antiporter, CPA1 family